MPTMPVVDAQHTWLLERFDGVMKRLVLARMRASHICALHKHQPFELRPSPQELLAALEAFGSHLQHAIRILNLCVCKLRGIAYPYKDVYSLLLGLRDELAVVSRWKLLAQADLRQAQTLAAILEGSVAIAEPSPPTFVRESNRPARTPRGKITFVDMTHTLKPKPVAHPK